MPANAGSLDLTDAYRRQLAALRARTTTIVARSWASVRLEDLVASHTAWLAANTEVVTASKRAAAEMSASYLAAYVASEVGRQVPVAPVATDAESSVQDDRTVEAVLASSIIAVRYALARSAGGAQALQAGSTRAQRIAALEVAQTARNALSDGMRAEDRVTGWRRATSPNACGACLGAATGAIRADDEVPAAHTYCRCVAEPVVKGVRERAPRPTGQQLFDALSVAAQNALFAGRGGEEKAELIRTGRVELEELVAPAPMATVGDGITERPLAELVSR